MVRFKQLLDTPANWTANNPILARGEIGVEREAGFDKLKIGDGLTAWNTLPYFSTGTNTILENLNNGFFKLTVGQNTPIYIPATTTLPI